MIEHIKDITHRLTKMYAGKRVWMNQIDFVNLSQEVTSSPIAQFDCDPQESMGMAPSILIHGFEFSPDDSLARGEMKITLKML